MTTGMVFLQTVEATASRSVRVYAALCALSLLVAASIVTAQGLKDPVKAVSNAGKGVIKKSGEMTGDLKKKAAALDRARLDATNKVLPLAVSRPAGEALESAKHGANAFVSAQIDAAEAAAKQLKVPFDSQVKAVTSAAHGRPLAEIGAGLDESRRKYQSLFGDEILAETKGINAPIDTGTNLYELTYSSVAGDTGKKLAQPVTVPLRLATALNLSAGQYADLVAKGEDPAMIVAVPLATLIDEAIVSLRPRAQAMPAEWRKYLSAHYSAGTLASAQYVIDGKFEITLPNGINVFAKGTAVTLGSLTVFPSMPDFNHVEDRHWWAHETKHIVQYAMFGGTLQFAYEYIKHCPELERDADRAADATLLQNNENEIVPPSTHCRI